MRGFLFLSICLISCWSSPSPSSVFDEEGGNRDLIHQNVLRIEKERQILDSLSVAWGWRDTVNAGGVLVNIIEDNDSENNQPDDHVVFDIRVSLVNGNECFSFDSLHFSINHYEGAKAFEAVARVISPGDSCQVLVPSDLGYGMRGVLGVVPPGAMLLFEIRQLDSEVDPE